MIEEEIIATKNTKRNRELEENLLPTVIDPEANFLRLPFFALSWRGLRTKTKTEYRFVDERNGKKAELLWRVTTNAEYGYPTSIDRKVARSIDVVINETIVCACIFFARESIINGCGLCLLQGIISSVADPMEDQK